MPEPAVILHVSGHGTCFSSSVVSNQNTTTTHCHTFPIIPVATIVLLLDHGKNVSIKLLLPKMGSMLLRHW
jgi:hypothetical protein